MSDEKKWKTEWVYCPECGSSEFRKHMLGDEEERICFACGQIWFTDIDYTDTIIKVITALRTRLTDAERRGIAKGFRKAATVGSMPGSGSAELPDWIRIHFIELAEEYEKEVG